MKNAVQINEVYVGRQKSMVLMERGILSLDGVTAINAFRRAIEAEKKALRDAKDDVIPKTCKSK